MMRRQTKIVATVGPACDQLAQLKDLVAAGVDVFRVNASHTSPDGLKRWIRLIRKTSHQVKKPVAVLVDLQGPRIRTGRLAQGKMTLRKGDFVSILPGAVSGSGSVIATPCRVFARMVKPGDHILIDNGNLELRVIKIAHRHVNCQVISGGILGENKGINLPHAPDGFSALTAKDRGDLEVALEMGADYLALSFVRTAKDIVRLKEWMRRMGKRVPVIAKIEKPGAFKEIESILRVTDGIMVARGDLGIEMGVEKVPVAQKKMIELANYAGLPVITATQMLESMMEHPLPTRAEASDIANAVFDGTDAVMLSGETAVGKYSREAVATMARVIVEAERYVGAKSGKCTVGTMHHKRLPVHAIAHAARDAACEIGAKAIVVYSRSGETAMLVSKLRPPAPIIALAPSEEIRHRLVLYRNVLPMKISFQGNTDQMLREGDRAILAAGILKRGDCVVVVSGDQVLAGVRYAAKIHWMGNF
ncbi:MAG: pyruvate kinase [Candidatus Omnitrophica bacterium]|nr:pyruvate kinase [Candidatus Omnitrophota bacterium]MDD5670147.1 pyruvate kinase [Candidatus Omnitrophota bacterium]